MISQLNFIYSTYIYLISLGFFIIQIKCNMGTWMSLGMQGVGLMNNELDSLSTSSETIFQPSFQIDNQILHNNINGNIMQSYQQHQQQHKYLLKQQIERLSCNELVGLSKGQTQICELNKDHIYFIGRAAQIGIGECQHQFQKSRWNCSTFNDSSVFGPLLNTASKEVAFTHAISSAAVVHSLARACRDGALSNCGCSRAKRPDSLKPQWKWAGCGDNIDYAYRFGKPFVDVREEEQNFNKNSKNQGRKLMNLHNNEAGRLAVIKKTRVTCKCHGVSGSCSVITCWQQLSSFREVGDWLKDRYEAATEVHLNKRGKLQVTNKKFARPTKLDLVYVDDSPDYCSANNLVTIDQGIILIKKINTPVFNSTTSEPFTLKNILNQDIPVMSKLVAEHPFKNGRKYRKKKTSKQISSKQKSKFKINDKMPKAARLTLNENNSDEDNLIGSSLDQRLLSSSIVPNLTYQQQQKLSIIQQKQYAQLLKKKNQLSENTVKPIKTLAWLGTHGRECNRSSLATDNCSLMCCGRGYNTQRVLVKEKCNCKFNWCCYVECETCTFYKTIHTCK